MALMDFNIDTSGSPQDVQRKQALADALMKQGMDSSPAAGGKYGGWATALNRGLAGALGGYQRGAAADEEQQGQASARQALAQALGADGKVNPQAYLQAASNPFASSQQMGAVGKVADWQHQTEQDAEHKREFGVTSGFQANADKRAQYEFDHTPDQYAPNPRANEPGQPAYIDQYAQAKAGIMAPPDGFEPNPAAATDPTAPKLRPMSGGPKDPATIAAETEAKQGSGMGDGAVEILARRLNAGDSSALQNVGRGAQSAKNIERIQNKAAEILQAEEGLSASDAAKRITTNIQSFKASQVGQSAEARTGATREANLNLILKATDAAIPAALEASHEVARTGFVPLNKIIQGGQIMTSDPNLKKFAMANLQLAEHWARAMNPTGVMRESDRDKALSILSTADSEPTYKAMVNQLRTQITRERDAVRGSIPETPEFKGTGGSPATTPAAAPADPLGIR